MSNTSDSFIRTMDDLPFYFNDLKSYHTASVWFQHNQHGKPGATLDETDNFSKEILLGIVSSLEYFILSKSRDVVHLTRSDLVDLELSSLIRKSFYIMDSFISYFLQELNDLFEYLAKHDLMLYGFPYRFINGTDGIIINLKEKVDV